MPVWDPESYLDASINGVSFFVTRDEAGFGRKGFVFETAAEDGARYVDLGARATTFTVFGFVIGDDYFEKKRALLDVFARPAPYELVHPHYGAMRVAIQQGQVVRVLHEDLRARMVQIEMPLIRVVDGLIARPDTEAAVSSAVDRYHETVESQPLTLATRAARVREKIDEVSEVLTDVQSRISSKLGQIQQVTDSVDRFRDNVAGLAQAPDQLMAKLRDGVSAVLDLANTVIVRRNPVSNLEDSAERAEALTTSIVDLVTFGQNDAPFDEDSVAGREEARNARGLNAAVRLASLAEASRQYSKLELFSAKDARVLNDTMVAYFDAALDDASAAGVDGPALSAAVDVRSALSRHLSESQSSLSEVTNYTPLSPTPSIIIAWELYGDPERAEEVARHNDLVDPNLAPAYVALEVRTR